MIQFYAPDILIDHTLPPSDSAHCSRVLRLCAGDEVVVVDGKGHRYRCVIASAHPRHTVVEIAQSEDVHPVWTQNITVAVAPTKNMDRMEWLVEKLTEVGVNNIVPLLCERSERKEIKPERLEKIAVSAMKQSLKATLPTIYSMQPLSKALELTAGASQRFIAYCNREIPRRELSVEYKPAQDVAIFIGPEGDFSPAEINMVLGNGFIPVSLGDNRLRTETAALYSVSSFHILDSAAAGYKSEF